MAVVAGCGPTPSAGMRQYLRSTFPDGAHAVRANSGGVTTLPPGKGPFPAVIVLHGCGGRGPSQLIWARRLNGWGYAALIPDSLTPRGVRRVCEPELQGFVTPRDRVGDVFSALTWLQTRPEIIPNRIAVLGLSHGGAAAVTATERQYENFGLRAAVDYYGPCVDPAAHGNVPLPR